MFFLLFLFFPAVVVSLDLQQLKSRRAKGKVVVLMHLKITQKFFFILLLLVFVCQQSPSLLFSIIVVVVVVFKKS